MSHEATVGIAEAVQTREAEAISEGRDEELRQAFDALGIVRVEGHCGWTAYWVRGGAYFRLARKDGLYAFVTHSRGFSIYDEHYFLESIAEAVGL